MQTQERDLSGNSEQIKSQGELRSDINRDVAMIIKCHSIYCSGRRGEKKDGGEEVSQDGRGGKEKGARTAEESGGGSH